MEVIYSTEKLTPINSSVLTVGSYDGIHRGHQKLLSTLVEYSNFYNLPSVLITFDPHPQYILNDKVTKLSLIMNLEQKLEIIKSIGIDYVYIINFTIEFSQISAQNFLTKTVIPFFNPKKIIIGYNHHFGKDRKGSPSFLKKFGKNNDIDIKIIKPVLDSESEISSSKIRQLLKSGFVRRANYELGTYFSFFGNVVHGAGRGKDLTFPTANIKPIEIKQLFPKKGVYLVRGRIIGLNAFGMCNIGVRPTFGESKLIMEIHFFHDNVKSLYGRKVKIEFLERIRDERKFPTSKDLTKQLKIDKNICLKLSCKYK